MFWQSNKFTKFPRKFLHFFFQKTSTTTQDSNLKYLSSNTEANTNIIQSTFRPNSRYMYNFLAGKYWSIFSSYAVDTNAPNVPRPYISNWSKVSEYVFGV